jgi:hypothetical protein
MVSTLHQQKTITTNLGQITAILMHILIHQINNGYKIQLVQINNIYQILTINGIHMGYQIMLDLSV